MYLPCFAGGHLVTNRSDAPTTNTTKKYILIINETFAFAKYSGDTFDSG